MHIHIHILWPSGRGIVHVSDGLILFFNVILLLLFIIDRVSLCVYVSVSKSLSLHVHILHVNVSERAYVCWCLSIFCWPLSVFARLSLFHVSQTHVSSSSCHMMRRVLTS